MHEIFWILQCNRTKNNESTFFILSVIIDRFFVRNWVLLYMNVYAKRSVDPPAIYSLSSVFHWYIWCKLSELFKYRKYQLTERWLEGKLERFFGVSKQNGAHRKPNKSKSKCLICKGHLQQICAVLVLCALKTVQWIYADDIKIKNVQMLNGAWPGPSRQAWRPLCWQLQ